MAELAIPLIALGTMYIISKQDKELKESFSNMKTEPLEKNYPVLEENKNNIMNYSNPNQITDEFFDQNKVTTMIEQNNPENSVGGGNKTIYSINGKPIIKDDFKHNNMVPFFGSKIKGASIGYDTSERMLDTKQGRGTHYISKTENAPLFKPQDNVHNVYGSQNMTDFYQSRVNPSMRMANVKPFEEQRVAPGLNKGFTTEGGVGFNTGMEARELWQPKNVDELRVVTNPKLSFELNGHEGPANSFNKSSSTIYTQGIIEKNRPDTDYELGKDRWFTSTGLEKGQTLRSIEEMKYENRSDTHLEYYGSNGSKMNEASYSSPNYLPSNRNVLNTNPMINPTNALSSGNYQPTDGDYGNKGYNVLPNNRSTTKAQDVDEYGVVQGVMKAMFAPIMDIMKPSRKENVIMNTRMVGDVGSTVSNMPVFNPADRLRTTIKEMTGDKLDNNHLNIERQTGSGYLVNEQQSVQVQRDTTNRYYNGVVAPSLVTAPTTYDAAYNQRNNANKTYLNRPNQGGTQIFNQRENIDIHKLDSDRDNNRLWVKNGGIYSAPNMSTHGELSGKTNAFINDTHNFERISPDILTAFKMNPYTHSLNSWV